MLVFSDATLSPQEVETGKEYLLRIGISEVDTSWDNLKAELFHWQELTENYRTWRQVKER